MLHQRKVEWFVYFCYLFILLSFFPKNWKAGIKEREKGGNAKRKQKGIRIEKGKKKN